MDFAQVMRDKQDFKTSGALRGEAGNPLGSWHSGGRLGGVWLKSFEAAQELGLIEYVVYSYVTPIAWRVMGGWVVPDARYSVTTARHSSKIRTAARNCGAMWVRDSEDEAFIDSFRESE